MKTTTALYKQLLSAYNSRKYVVTINMTLADNTSLTLTEADIWENSFEISTASSGTSSFDIGCAVIGKCKFQLNNFDESLSQYDFFNATATVWVGLVGDIDENDNQVYYRMGFFTVDEPSFAGSLISLELLDNMWKFDVPLSDVNLSYPVTALSAVNAICSYCGVTNATQSFHGSSFSIAQAPTEDINCREMLQYIAMIGCNFCIVDAQGNLNIKWYDTPSTPSASNTDQFAKNFLTTIGTDEIVITGVKFTLNDTPYLIGRAGYVLELENPLVTTANVNTVLNLIWDVLEGFTLRTFNINTIADLAVEVGDYCAITDAKGNVIYSHITNNSFGFANHQVSLGAVTPNRSLTKRYSKAVQAAVEVARTQASQVVSEYDLAVQMMNNLAVNAMGAYQDYQDMPTGGRVYFLSNMPITKDPITGVCSFESGSTVFKASGDGFFVSTDGGTTWTNGYNAQTGQLVVNVLNAIGISAEWIKTGILDVGGSGTNATIRVKDAQNNVICTINQNGITMSKGVLQSADYSYTSGNFSDSGMIIDLINTYLRSTAFELNNNGGHIGLAEFDEDSLQVVGDVELYSGSGTFEFRPTDYYFATDFKLLLKTTSGTATVTLILHENDQDETIGTYTATTSGVETALLDHLIGTDPDDYYKVVCSASCSVAVEDAYLAYMGLDGFKGTLEGIFRGFVESNAGSINTYNYNGYGKFTHGDDVVDWTGFRQYTNAKAVGFDSNGAWVINTANGGDHHGLIVALDSTFDEETDGYADAETSVPRVDIHLTGGNNSSAQITKEDSSGPDTVMWSSDFNSEFNSRFTISTTDIGEGVPLAQGHFWLVYE